MSDEVIENYASVLRKYGLQKLLVFVHPREVGKNWVLFCGHNDNAILVRFASLEPPFTGCSSRSPMPLSEFKGRPAVRMNNTRPLTPTFLLPSFLGAFNAP